LDCQSSIADMVLPFAVAVLESVNLRTSEQFAKSVAVATGTSWHAEINHFVKLLPKSRHIQLDYFIHLDYRLYAINCATKKLILRTNTRLLPMAHKCLQRAPK
jgi:hypothetical protein